LSKEHQKAVVAKAGKITAADVKREAPAPVAKPAPNALRNAHAALRKAISTLLVECNQQGDVMVFEIRCETIAAIRAAL
jgi:hypothetical protein